MSVEKEVAGAFAFFTAVIKIGVSSKVAVYSREIISNSRSSVSKFKFHTTKSRGRMQGRTGLEMQGRTGRTDARTYGWTERLAKKERLKK